jgi:LmbE family N-acetylglucosaminyl deacetylase
MKLRFALSEKAGAPLTLLCLGAHSDDIEIGCGGSILKLLAHYSAAHVVWVVFSGDHTRAREARASARLFLRSARRTHVDTHDFRTSYFPAQFGEIKDVFEKLKGFVDPDLIFTHTRDDFHQDHRVICDLTWNTFRHHCILEYEVPKYDGDTGSPNVFIELNRGLVRRKTDHILKCFGSQRDRHWFTSDTFTGLARLRGIQCAARGGFAEAYYGRKISFT